MKSFVCGEENIILTSSGVVAGNVVKVRTVEHFILEKQPHKVLEVATIVQNAVGLHEVVHGHDRVFRVARHVHNLFQNKDKPSTNHLKSQNPKQLSQ